MLNSWDIALPDISLDLLEPQVYTVEDIQAWPHHNVHIKQKWQRALVGPMVKRRASKEIGWVFPLIYDFYASHGLFDVVAATKVLKGDAAHYMSTFTYFRLHKYFSENLVSITLSQIFLEIYVMNGQQTHNLTCSKT